VSGKLGQIGMLAAAAAMSPTVVASAPPRTRSGAAIPVSGRATTPTPPPEPAPANGARRRSRFAWIGSIGYIYVYARGRLHATERRRRLIGERDGAQALLAGAVREVGATILRDRIEHPDLAGLLESIARAQARRQAALGDVTASEKQKENEESHLAAQEATTEAHFRVSERAMRDADELLRGVDADLERASSRLGRVRDERARISREISGAAAAPDAKPRLASLRHDDQGLGAEQQALDEQAQRLERQQAELREKTVALRADATTARAQLDQAIANRRQAASAMAATLAGHVRDRAESERALADLTEQLGRAAAELRPDRPAGPEGSTLPSAYQRIDRLQETIADRTIQIAELEKASAHYDQRKLATGVGLLASFIVATGVVLWAVLK
jgi:hypothetical protein